MKSGWQWALYFGLFVKNVKNFMRVLRARENTETRRSYIGTNTHNYCQLTRVKRVSSTLANRDAGGPTNNIFMFMTSSYTKEVAASR